MKVSCSAPMGAPTAADRIRNPGYRPTYSGLFTFLIEGTSCLQAGLHAFYGKVYISHLSHRELIWSANFAISLLVMTP